MDVCLKDFNDGYTVAHSPDADDVFMYYALYFGWINTSYKFKNVALDIDTLNKSATRYIYDITAISFALYSFICDRYSLLRTGVSFGYGYGPKLVKRRGKSLGRNFKVALSGEHTTNAVLFRIRYKDSKVVYKNFLDIEAAVLSGEVDAGVLIHESILNFSDELEVETTIWDIWQDLSKSSLPLPLGGMVLRRSIPLNRAIEIEGTLKEAISVALEFKDFLSNMLVSNNLVRVRGKDLDTYLGLYANENSVCLNQDQLKSLQILYELEFEHGLCNKIWDVSDYLLPVEYNSLRNS